MRIGTNHGSLSDRIMSRYGDTPLGMVESALEFLRICEDEEYYNIVISMKSSNTQVMVEAYRMLVAKLKEEEMKPYPLHLGVTEAGEGEDGRIKSAVGIGTLLEDGIGDTVRVSLTEAAEFEAPVAKALIDRYKKRSAHDKIEPITNIEYSPYEYKRRETNEIMNFGGTNVPRVIADLSHIKEIKYDDLKEIGHFYLSATDKWGMNDQGVDYIYTWQHKIGFMLPNGVREIMDYVAWGINSRPKHVTPLLNIDEFLQNECKCEKIVRIKLSDINGKLISAIMRSPKVILMLSTKNLHAMAELRRAMIKLEDNGIKTPVIFERSYDNLTDDQFQLYAATDLGGLLIDGFGDSIMLKSNNNGIKACNSIAFGILQAARTRMSKTEYISCPSCGRTLFDLQETTAMIRKRTDHLKGLKIGIMGCIVNGPGEMADADYGYVGSGPGKITLYRGKEVVKRNIPFKDALDELIELIKSEGDWIEPEHVGQEELKA